MSGKILNEKSLKVIPFFTEARYDIAAEHVKKGGSIVVDIGCGENIEENYIRLIEKEVYIIAVEKERENLPRVGNLYKEKVDIVQADARMLPFRNGAADFAIDFGTSKNLTSGESRIVEEAVRILKKNGYFARLSDDPYNEGGWIEEVYGVIDLTGNSLKILKIYRDTSKNRTLAIYQKEGVDEIYRKEVEEKANKSLLEKCVGKYKRFLKNLVKPVTEAIDGIRKYLKRNRNVTGKQRDYYVESAENKYAYPYVWIMNNSDYSYDYGGDSGDYDSYSGDWWKRPKESVLTKIQEIFYFILSSYRLGKLILNLKK